MAAARARRSRSWRVPCAAMVVPVTVTREPGGTTAGEKIREVLLHSATTGLSPFTELALMFAARAQHIDEVILPALAEGRVVLCDRFTDSTEAYQGGGRKLGTEVVLRLHKILCGDLQPDLTILLDNNLAYSLERARRRNRKLKAGRSEKEKDENRFEQESQAFFGTRPPRVFSHCRSCAASSACRERPRHAERDACDYHGVGEEEVEVLRTAFGF